MQHCGIEPQNLVTNRDLSSDWLTSCRSSEQRQRAARICTSPKTTAFVLPFDENTSSWACFCWN